MKQEEQKAIADSQGWHPQDLTQGCPQFLEAVTAGHDIAKACTAHYNVRRLLKRCAAMLPHWFSISRHMHAPPADTLL